MNRSVFALIPFLAATLAADEVHLRGGGKIVGQIVEETHDAVVIEVGPGRITLPAERVDHIVAGRSPLSVYHQRAANLALSDVDGWLDVGLYAQRHGLTTQAREAFERVLAYSPENPIAQAALGNVKQSGRWMSEEEAYRERGMVRHGGRWTSKAERDEHLRWQQQQDLERQQRREADARVREAEARATAAEADARRAEARADTGNGIPLGYGGGAAVYNPYSGRVIVPGRIYTGQCPRPVTYGGSRHAGKGARRSSRSSKATSARRSGDSGRATSARRSTSRRSIR